MRRAWMISLALISPTLLVGCPIYPEEPYGCTSSADCGSDRACDLTTGTCYVPKGGSGGSSSSTTCKAPSDCGVNETCSKSGECRIGDCSFHGCVSGYHCDIADGTYSCVADPGSGGSGGQGGSDSGSAGQGGSDSGTAGQGGSDSGTAGQDGGNDSGTAGQGGTDGGVDAAADGSNDASSD
ncbi:MAG: hypothetical protein R3B13_04410 [Polyangiaceae bacterium]